MVYQGIYSFLISLNYRLPWSLDFVQHTKWTVRIIPFHPSQHIKLKMAFSVSLSVAAAWYDIVLISFQHEPIRFYSKAPNHLLHISIDVIGYDLAIFSVHLYPVIGHTFCLFPWYVVVLESGPYRPRGRKRLQEWALRTTRSPLPDNYLGEGNSCFLDKKRPLSSKKRRKSGPICKENQQESGSSVSSASWDSTHMTHQVGQLWVNGTQFPGSHFPPINVLSP